MSKLYLHIGHGKTGTSYLQAVFAHNAPLLAEHGIDYPGSGRVMREAASGATTSGNRAIFLKKFQDDPKFFASERSMLFSGESLWGQFWEADFAPKLARIAQESGKAVEILFFIRDPVELLLSDYLQNVQQRAKIPKLNQFAGEGGGKRQAKHMERVLSVQQQCADHGFGLTMVNYSRARDQLLEKTKTFLNLPKDADFQPPARIVNRSIGAFEMGVKQGLSTAFDGMNLPENKNYIRRLVEATSELKMPPPVLSDAALAAFSKIVAPVMEQVNAYLPQETQYQLQYTPPPPGNTPFTEEYGARLAKEVARATLVMVAQNLDDAGRETVLGHLISNDMDVDLQMLRQYAGLLMRRKAFEEAIPIYQKIIDSEPTAEAYFQTITCFRHLKRLDRALDCSVQLFEFDPLHEGNVSVLVNLLAQKSAFKEARAVLAHSSRSGLPEDKLHFLTYRIECYTGNKEVALSALKAAATASPENKRYQDLLAKG